MEAKLNSMDHYKPKNLNQIIEKLKNLQCTSILIKKLRPNNNDKNQIYIHPNPDFLNNIFDLEFSYRAPSTSKKKKGARLPIPIAKFNSFAWVNSRGQLNPVPDCKGIFYAQYPEMRLSGFKSDQGKIPGALSVQFVKEHPRISRFLLIGADSTGRAYAILTVDPDQDFINDYEKLPFAPDSRACKFIELEIAETGSERLKALLTERVAGKSIKGCRLDSDGNTLPFTGTQVHGYTLEHELGILPNASKDGDIFGIELKCFTKNKLTLFTPEPDGGLYFENFNEFMLRYGYAKEAVYRFTGLHRAGTISEKSGLSLFVLCSDKESEDDSLRDYIIHKPFKDQLKNLQVVLMDEDRVIAASWSLSRLLNNWGVKHNEVVYVPAKVSDNYEEEEKRNGFTKRVTFGSEVLWCRKSSIERMVKAIATGTIFLDPAPKYDPDNPKNNKRRSQWRVNNIYRDAVHLYEEASRVILIDTQ